MGYSILNKFILVTMILVSCALASAQSYTLEKFSQPSEPEMWRLIVHIGPNSNLVSPDSKRFKALDSETVGRFVDFFLDAVIGSYVRDGVLNREKDKEVIESLVAKERPNPEKSNDSLVMILKKHPADAKISEDVLLTFRVARPDEEGLLPMEKNYPVEAEKRKRVSDIEEKMALRGFPDVTKNPLPKDFFEGGLIEIKNFSRPAGVTPLHPRAIQLLYDGIIVHELLSAPILKRIGDKLQVVAPTAIVAEAASPDLAKNLGLTLKRRLSNSSQTPIYLARGEMQEVLGAMFWSLHRKAKRVRCSNF